MAPDLLVWISLVAFLGGIGWKVWGWFKGSLRREGGWGRLGAALRGIYGTILSRKVLVLLKALLLDVVLQLRTYREDRYRWLMHLFLYWGFGLLIVTHALGKVVIEGYVSTAMPFLFLRDLFGVMALVGALMAVGRRLKGIPRFRSAPMDIYAIVVVVLILLSGFFLKGVRITSYKAYLEMVSEYAALSEEEERALEAYWVKSFGLISPNVRQPSKDLISAGAEIHEFSCAPCHASPKWAFLSYGISKAVRPLARPLDRFSVPGGLRWFHVLLCLFALAILPFTKFFHLISVPLSLLLNAVIDPRRSSPLNLETKRMVELDACVHCGTCTAKCAVSATTEVIPNRAILPSEKIPSLKVLASGKPLGEKVLREILEGVYLCTNCLRCTVSCPSGIDLQELWFEAREALLQRGLVDPVLLTPFSFYRGLRREDVGENYQNPLLSLREKVSQAFGPPVEPLSIGPPEVLDLSSDARTFRMCFSCQTCTNVCPVVSQYERPKEVLGLLPHQIMRACALGLREMALGAPMLWMCLTCYQCQELCPQGVNVTDVLIELRGLMVKALKEGRDEVRPVSGM